MAIVQRNETWARTRLYTWNPYLSWTQLRYSFTQQKELSSFYNLLPPERGKMKLACGVLITSSSINAIYPWELYQESIMNNWCLAAWQNSKLVVLKKTVTPLWPWKICARRCVKTLLIWMWPSLLAILWSLIVACIRAQCKSFDTL
jgi:hypothetical protein